MKRWEIAQWAEREGWRNWKKYLKSHITREKLAKYWSYYIDLITRYIHFKSEWKILEIGCGPQGIINYISFGKKFGLDPLMDFYLAEFELPTNVEWRKGVMEDIPFRDEYFDVVITTNTLDHCYDPMKGLKEIYRVLKKEGFLVLTVDCYAPIRQLLRIIKEKVGKGDSPHPFSFSQRQVRAMLRKTGFSLLANYRGIGTMGLWFYEAPKEDKFDKIIGFIFWLESKFFGYSRLDFIFIAQKR